MKKFSHLVILLAASCVAYLQCGPKEPEPTPVLPITSEIFLNGELTDFAPDIRRLPNSDVIVYTFDQRKGVYLNEIAVYPVPATTGDFGKYVAFQQLHGDDQGNHIYEAIEVGDAFFRVEGIDDLNKTVKGSFQVKFRRTASGKETPDSHLPDTLLFKGTFDSKWREY